MAKRLNVSKGFHTVLMWKSWPKNKDAIKADDNRYFQKHLSVAGRVSASFMDESIPVISNNSLPFGAFFS